MGYGVLPQINVKFCWSFTQGSKYPNMKYVPQTIITTPTSNSGTIENPRLGTSDPYGTVQLIVQNLHDPWCFEAQP